MHCIIIISSPAPFRGLVPPRPSASRRSSASRREARPLSRPVADMEEHSEEIVWLCEQGPKWWFTLSKLEIALFESELAKGSVGFAYNPKECHYRYLIDFRAMTQTNQTTGTVTRLALGIFFVFFWSIFWGIPSDRSECSKTERKSGKRVQKI